MPQAGFEPPLIILSVSKDLVEERMCGLVSSLSLHFSWGNHFYMGKKMKCKGNLPRNELRGVNYLLCISHQERRLAHVFHG